MKRIVYLISIPNKPVGVYPIRLALRSAFIGILFMLVTLIYCEVTGDNEMNFKGMILFIVASLGIGIIYGYWIECSNWQQDKDKEEGL